MFGSFYFVGSVYFSFLYGKVYLSCYRHKHWHAFSVNRTLTFCTDWDLSRYESAWRIQMRNEKLRLVFCELLRGLEL